MTFQVNGSDNINGASTLVISATHGKATLCPTTGSGWYATVQSQAVLPDFPLAVVNGGTGASTASGTSLDNITGFASTGLINRTGAGAYSFAALPLAVANGGTASASASGTALDNITGFSGTGLVNRTGAGAYSFLAVPLLPVNGGTGEAGTITGALKGNGISPATQAACSDLSNGATGCSTAITNGTFTPVLQFGGASVGITYTSQLGTYTHFGTGTGSRVCINITLVTSSKGSSTGAVAISALPFTSQATIAFSIANSTGLSYTGTLESYIGGGSSSLVIASINGGASFAQLTNASVSNVTDYYISGCYTSS